MGRRVRYSKRVDTCAAEFSTSTGIFCTNLWWRMLSQPDRVVEKIMILGGMDPTVSRSGIGIDYCLFMPPWHYAKNGYETLVVNCNPETGSPLHYDTSDRLYFESLHCRCTGNRLLWKKTQRQWLSSSVVRHRWNWLGHWKSCRVPINR